MLVRTRFSMGVIVSFALLLSGAVTAAAQNHPITRWNVKHDVSAPLSEMIKNAPKVTAHRKHEAEPLRRIPLPPGLGGAAVEDTVRQQTTAAATPPASLNIDGLGNGQLGFTVNSAPPDTDGAVGATQYVQLVNASFAVFNKSTGALVAGPTTTNTLWSGFGGGCQTNDDGDGIVLYDKLANRWVISQFSVSTTPFLQCVAVSTTSDATGTYNRYSFQYSNFDDYPKMGIWPDGYYDTFNMFDSSNNFVGADACAYNRAAMLTGAAAQQVCFQQGSGVGGLLPSDLDGTTAPPSGSPNYQIFFGTNSLQLFKFHVDFNNTANSTYTGPTNIPVAAFSPLCGGGTCVVQPSGGNQLDSLADRLMFRLAYRNLGTHESLLVNHSIVSGSSGGVRWYEVQNPNGTPVVAQQSTFAPDANFRWMGSMAMDQSGDIALGYSVSSSSVDPSVRFTGRLASDPASTMGTEVNAVTGGGVQNGSTSNGPLTRWGDYSAMTVDPVDDCTFWYTQEYMKTTGSFNWNTRIVNFKFPSCGGTATPDYSLSASPSSLTVVQGNSGTSTITVNPVNGFTGSVSLAASGLPSGVTASFNPTSTTGTSTLTLTASSTATTGTATVTITGTSGSLSHTTTVTLTVNAQATPNYTLSASPSSLTVVQGNSGTSTITVNPVNGFTGSVSLAASGLPSGVTAGFNPTSTTGTSTLTLTASSSATTGTATVTITGTSGSLSHTTTVSLTVSASSSCISGTLSNGGFEAGNTSCWTTGGVFPPVTSTVQKHSGNFSALLGASSGAEPNGDSSMFQTINVPLTGTTTLSFWYWPSTTDTIQFDWQEAQVQNSSGTLLAQIFKVASNTQAWTNQTFNLTPYAGQTIRLFFNDHQDGAGDLTYMYLDDVTVTNTTAAPDFTLSDAPTSVAVTQGGSGTSTITVHPLNGFASSVNLSASGLPSGVTAAFNPTSTTGTSTLTLTASSTATTGTVTVTITGTSGSLTHTTTLSLTVSSSGAQQLLGNPGFENGTNTAPWTLTAGVINNSSSEPPHSGSWDAWMDGYGTTHTDTSTQTVTIPSTATTATLSFWLHIDTAETTTTSAFDVMSVQVLNTSGTVLATLGTFSNLNHATGYQQHSFSVLAFKGQTVQIRFTGTEDASLQTSFVLDDTALNVQ
jgi:hypothetical protein